MAVMAKFYARGTEVLEHRHKRDQLIYAKSGVMRVATKHETWIVPPDRAVYILAGTQHTVSMRGDVEMRTLYIDPFCGKNLPKTLGVFEVSMLLEALILNLQAEPIDYEIQGRGGDMVRLILSEITSAKSLSLTIPMPRDRRLYQLCNILLNDPQRSETLDAWSVIVGASSRTLLRLFISETGLSFSAWRQRVRFHNALEALVQGESVNKVARANGYQSPSAFSHSFQKVIGATPSSLKNTSKRSGLSSR